MTKHLPTAHPAEVLQITPEALMVANSYLQLQNAMKVSEELDIPIETITQILARREVKSYVDHVFFELGFNNRFTLRKAMDAIISKKFEDMDEAGVGSSKDIIEILALSHKMTMETLDKELQLEKLRGNSIKSQVNVQINESGSNYGSLIERLISNNI